MVEIVWHRRETRRQQRRQTSTCTTRRTRSTLQKLGISKCGIRIADSGIFNLLSARPSRSVEEGGAIDGSVGHES